MVASAETAIPSVRLVAFERFRGLRSLVCSQAGRRFRRMVRRAIVPVEVARIAGGGAGERKRDATERRSRESLEWWPTTAEKSGEVRTDASERGREYRCERHKEGGAR